MNVKELLRMINNIELLGIREEKRIVKLYNDDELILMVKWDDEPPETEWDYAPVYDYDITIYHDWDDDYFDFDDFCDDDDIPCIATIVINIYK